MKQLFLGLLSFLLIASSATAQSGKSDMKAAQKAFNAFKLSQTDVDKLKEAMTSIDAALEDSEMAASTKAWKLKGDIYKSAVQADMAAAVLNPEYQTQFASAGLDSYQAYSKLFDMAEKKYDKKDALAGMKEAAGSVSNAGIAAYEANDYENAFNLFSTVTEIHEKLTANGEESILATKDDVNNQIYITGLSALNGNMLDKAEPVFMQLKENGYEKAAVYEGLFKIKMEAEDMEGAEAVLTEGREKFPDDVSLLFSEINFYLKQNKLDVLVGKLESAIAAEPENISLYATLGNVYDNLFQRELEAGNAEKTQEYFDKALSQYDSALKIDGSYADAVYSKGALYYNLAAAKTKEMNNLPLTDVKGFEALKKETEELFEKALPLFKTAETMNPSDLNTLIALKEIFARKSDFETSGEFKKRIETVQAGGEVESSFFKQ
ncbi:MAG: tetratricopeptide repeat protein [Saprospiraceae bacterium]